jgi:hypothetical protein
MSARKFGTQALAGLQLMGFDQGAAIATASPRQPGEWTFGIVDQNTDIALRRRDLPPA